MNKEIRSEKLTLYISMKRCMNCFNLCEDINTLCPECGKMFLRVATIQEEQKYMKELEEKQK